MAIINRTRKVNKVGMKVGKNPFGTLHSGGNTESDGSGFGKLVFGVVASNGYDTKGMSFEEAYKIFKQLGGKSNWAMSKFEDKEEDKPKEEKDVNIENIKTSMNNNIDRLFANYNNKEILKEDIGKLNNEQLEVLNASFNAVKGWKPYELDARGRKVEGYCNYDGTIVLDADTIRTIDDKLGNKVSIEVISHESGHAFDMKHKITCSKEIIEISKESYKECVNKILEEAGYSPINNFERMTSSQKENINKAYNSLLSKGLDKTIPYKEKREFGLIGDSLGDDEILTMVSKSKSYKDFINIMFKEKSLRDDDYINKYYKPIYELFNNYINMSEEERAKREQEFKDYNTKRKEHNDKIIETYTMKRWDYSILGDFLQIASGDRIRLLSAIGHSKGFTSKGYEFGVENEIEYTSAQSECFAEYMQSKVQSREDGLNALRTYMPKLYKAFEDAYNKYKGE